MGVVYRARQRSLDKTVAVKILRPEFLTNPTVMKRFRREALAASALGSPHVVQVIDFGTTRENTPFIAMEYVEGSNFAELVERHGPLPVERAVDLILQIADGLEDAHTAGLIHRDLKPANLIVTRHRGADLAKILDFGIARHVDPKLPGGTRITSKGLVCGTPAFMSPEQVAGARLDARSDLFSLNLVLYFLLTASLPFEGKTPSKMARAILTEEPIPPRSLRPEVPRELERLIQRNLSKSPEHRSQSASELRSELRAIIGPTPRRRRISRPSWRPRWPSTGNTRKLPISSNALAVLLGVLLGLIGLFIVAPEPEPKAEEPEPQHAPQDP